MQRPLGIDLGTTNSVMAHIKRGDPQLIFNRENRDLTPSVVAQGRRGELLVGSTARTRSLMEPLRTISSVKRFIGRKFSDPDVQKALGQVTYRVSEGADGDVRVWIGDRDYSPTEISSLILYRLKQDAEERLHEKVTRAVITVPAYFGERQVAATREAGRMAGFHVLRIINEPTAAALAYGLNREQTDEASVILVYDLGGGTFDISLLMLMQGAFTVMGIEGDNLLGGDDFDRSLSEHLLKQVEEENGVDLSDQPRALQSIKSAAEEAKITLSSQQVSEVMIPALGVPPVELVTDISRQQFEAMIRERIDRTLELTQKAIEDAGLTPDNIDHILLVGGSTAIPLVEQMLEAAFGKGKLRKDVNPMQCVALGAAIQTALITDVECLRCQARSPITDDRCGQCGAPLVGVEKQSCPTCFMLSDLDATECWKCEGTLDVMERAAPAAVLQLPQNGSVPQTSEGAQKVPAPMFTSSVAQSEQTCPKCGKPYKPGTPKCVICGEVLVELLGLRCHNCGEVNPPGVANCVACNVEMIFSEGIMDVTPKDLGIELADERMSVVIPKGTNFPTTDPVTKEYYTSETNQRRLEIPVYEGANSMARQNDLCGIVSMNLPVGLPRGTGVSTSFGLDADRTVTVSVTLRTSPPQSIKVKLRRGGSDPERRRKVEAQRHEVVRFYDKWDKQEELTAPEGQTFIDMISRLDALLNEDSSAPTVFDSTLTEAKRLVETAMQVRYTDAVASNILGALTRYLQPEQLARMEQMKNAIQEARERADWTAGLAVADQIEKEFESYSGTLQLLLFIRNHAQGNRLSPALSHTIFTNLWQLEKAMDNNDADLASRSIDSLWSLWDQTMEELRRMGDEPQRISRVQDTRM